MDKLKRLAKLLTPYKTALIWGSIFLVISSATNLIVPMFIRDLVDVVMVKKDMSALNIMALSIFGLFIVQMIFSTGHNYLFDLTEKRVITDFRKKIFNHLHTLSLSFFAKRRTGEIMSRLTNDVTTVEGFVTDLPATLIQQSIRLLGGVVIIIYLNWKLTFTILVLLPVLVLYAKTYGKRLKFLSKEIQDKLANATTVVEENLSCIPVVKSFVRNQLEMDRYSDAVEDSFQSAKKGWSSPHFLAQPLA